MQGRGGREGEWEEKIEEEGGRESVRRGVREREKKEKGMSERRQKERERGGRKR